MRRILPIAAAAAVIAALGWALWPQPVPVDATLIGRQTIAVTVEDEGKTRIRDVFSVSAPLAGKMLRVDLHAGDSVTAGKTVVASIQPAAPALLDRRARRIAEAAVQAAQAAMGLALAQLRQANAQVEFLDGELDRATTLVRRGTIAARAFEKAKLDAETARAAAESAKANLLVRERELESAKAALTEGEGGGASECCVEVMAPVSGRVLRVLTESEQVVQAGTPLMELGDPADLEVVVDLLSSDAVRVRPGARATIDGWGGPGLSAAVERIDPSAVTKVSALGIEEQRVTVVLRPEGDAAAWASLGHEFRVVARIAVWTGLDRVAVPLGALFRSDGHWAVFCIVDGRARMQTVQLGERNSEHAEVTGGLQPGDTVVLHPSDRVADGVRVRIVTGPDQG